MEKLAAYRKELNSLDEQLVRLIAQRIDVCRNVALYKRESGIPMMQPQRVDEVKSRCANMGAELHVNPEFMRKLYSVIIEETCRVEDEIIEDGHKV
jgi:chorismate mutase-like protein